MRRRGTFLRLDHGFLDDPDHLALSRDALLLHICGLLYASKHLTDGVLDKNPRVVMQWAPHFVLDGVDVAGVAAELCDAGLWNELAEQWVIVGYCEKHDTREDAEQWRQVCRGRAQARKLGPFSLEQYGSTCHYCNEPIDLDDWHLDHVVPKSRGGADEVANLVPACVQCNLRKGAKTPLEWLGHACCEVHE